MVMKVKNKICNNQNISHHFISVINKGILLKSNQNIYITTYKFLNKKQTKAKNNKLDLMMLNFLPLSKKKIKKMNMRDNKNNK